MKNRLKDYFPSIWTVDEWDSWLQEDPRSQKIFREWMEEQQKEFLDLCTGVQGVDMLQPVFFQTVMDPERVSDFLSLIFKKKVRQLEIDEGCQKGQELVCLGSGLHLEFEDGETAYVEIWKAENDLSGQEWACHSARSLARKYQKEQQEKGKRFRYRDVGRVCTVILSEGHLTEMDKVPGTYLHTGRVCFDTGMELDLLQEYYFLDLGLYRQESIDKDIQGGLDGWMVFLGCRHPEKIVQLIKTYPRFKSMYEEVYEICRDAQKILHIFESELKYREKIQDRRTVEEMEKIIDKLTMQHEDDCRALEQQKIENQQREDKISRQYQEAMRRIEELEKMLS